jgi:uncharacterized protein (DUF58 family)
VSTRERQTFPLVPRRRLVGISFGTIPSRRRGHGADVIGSRPYEPGDPVSTIDWFATARLSSAAGHDEFVVRDRAADEAPRVAIVCDRRPAMGIYEPPFPWLSKGRALVEATAAIAASAAAGQSDVGAIDFAGAEDRGGDPYWLAPGRRHQVGEIIDRQSESGPFDAPEHNVAAAVAFLGRRRKELPAGSFLFVLSDFLVPVAVETWLDARANGWDVVPVVIQDPTWERSFPEVASVLVPLVDAESGKTFSVRMTPREVERRRETNERCHAELMRLFASLELDPVAISSSDPPDIDRAFLEWAELRRQTRWLR